MVHHQHITNSVTGLEEYTCVVDCRSDLLHGCYEAFKRYQQITSYGVKDVPCHIIFETNKVQLNLHRFPTQIYSKLLRCIRIAEDGVSLNKLSYNDLI